MVFSTDVASPTASPATSLIVDATSIARFCIRRISEGFSGTRLVTRTLRYKAYRGDNHSDANGTSLSKRSQDFALTLFEALALDVARLCQQAVWLRPSFHRARFATIRSPWQYQLCDCSQ